jgi:hypothetical protein
MTYKALVGISVGSTAKQKVRITDDGFYDRSGAKVKRYEPGDTVTGLKPREAKALLAAGAIKKVGKDSA